MSSDNDFVDLNEQEIDPNQHIMDAFNEERYDDIPPLINGVTYGTFINDKPLYILIAEHAESNETMKGYFEEYIVNAMRFVLGASNQNVLDEEQMLEFVQSQYELTNPQQVMDVAQNPEGEEFLTFQAAMAEIFSLTYIQATDATELVPFPPADEQPAEDVEAQHNPQPDPQGNEDSDLIGANSSEGQQDSSA